MSKYKIMMNTQNCVELSKPINTILTYRIPYKRIKDKDHGLNISNRFIVYILFGKNHEGRDVVYVGKSKNGLDYRPGSHEDKYANWTECFVLTDIKERTILNDGTIQYLENQINERINRISKYTNTTNQTTKDTANRSDMEDCDEFLSEAINMLYVLGLDLLEEEEEEESDVPFVDGPASVYSGMPLIFKPEETKFSDLFDQTEKIIYETIPDVRLDKMVYYRKYSKGKKTICIIKGKKDHLIMIFNAPYGTLNDPYSLLKDGLLPNQGHVNFWKNGSSFMRFKDNEHLEDFKDFINQTISYHGLS